MSTDIATLTDPLDTLGLLAIESARTEIGRHRAQALTQHLAAERAQLRAQAQAQQQRIEQLLAAAAAAAASAEHMRKLEAQSHG